MRNPKLVCIMSAFSAFVFVLMALSSHSGGIGARVDNMYIYFAAAIAWGTLAIRTYSEAMILELAERIKKK